jgi:hypothetical protein
MHWHTLKELPPENTARVLLWNGPNHLADFHKNMGMPWKDAFERYQERGFTHWTADVKGPEIYILYKGQRREDLLENLQALPFPTTEDPVQVGAYDQNDVSVPFGASVPVDCSLSVSLFQKDPYAAQEVLEALEERYAENLPEVDYFTFVHASWPVIGS